MSALASLEGVALPLHAIVVCLRKAIPALPDPDWLSASVRGNTVVSTERGKRDTLSAPPIKHVEVLSWLKGEILYFAAFGKKPSVVRPRGVFT